MKPHAQSMKPHAQRWLQHCFLVGIALVWVASLSLGCGKEPGTKSSPKSAPESAPDNADKPAASAEARAKKPARESPRTERAPAELDYIELLTGGAKAEEALPMIFGVHGLGDAPEGYGTLYEALPFKARVILPRGPKHWFGGGHSWFHIDLPFSAKQASLASGIGNAADQVAALMTDLVESKPTKGKPIVSGFSQGGMISFAVATRHPKKVGTAIPIGGALPEGLWPQAKADKDAPKIRAFNGDVDALVPIEAARATVAKLKEKGFDVILKEYEGVPHTIPTEMQADVFKVMKEVVGP